MWEAIKFWMAKQLAELAFVAALFLLLLFVIFCLCLHEQYQLSHFSKVHKRQQAEILKYLSDRSGSKYDDFSLEVGIRGLYSVSNRPRNFEAKLYSRALQRLVKEGRVHQQDVVEIDKNDSDVKYEKRYYSIVNAAFKVGE